MRSAPIALLALLLGCPSAPVAPGVVVVNDDDSAADDDDTGDDDDDVAQDRLWAWATLSHTDLLGPGAALAGSEVRAIASLGAGDPLPFADWGDLGGVPLPGVSLHPEPAASEEGCTELSSEAPLAPPPTSDAVGGVVRYAGAQGGTLELTSAAGAYVAAVDAPMTDLSWDLVVKGGGGWPPATLLDAFALPPPVAGVLPGPGALGNLAVVEFKWDLASDPAGVEILLFRWTTANQTAWRALRCRAEDDGSFFLNASPLAAGSGDIEVTLSRARWSTETRSVGEALVAPDLGAVRSIRFSLTPG